MIDYFALALGHGLIAIALLRLVLRDGVDVDPMIEQINAGTRANRAAFTAAGRNAARRMRMAADADGKDPAKDEPSLKQRNGDVE